MGGTVCCATDWHSEEGTLCSMLAAPGTGQPGTCQLLVRQSRRARSGVLAHLRCTSSQQCMWDSLAAPEERAAHTLLEGRMGPMLPARHTDVPTPSQG